VSEKLADADPSELILTLLDVAPSEVFTFEKIQPDGSKKPYRVRVRLLRVEEDHQCLASAQKYAKDRGETKDYGDIYKEAQAVALLAKALCRVEKRERPDGTSYYPPLFTSEEHLRASFTAAEMAQCLNMYELVRSKYNALRTLDDLTVAQWADRLGDPLNGPFYLALLDSSHWPSLLLSLARELRAEYVRTGRLQSPSPDSSESGQESLETGTGSFTELPSAHSEESDIELPTDHLLTPDEAREKAGRIYKRRPKK
jgi:hypothetical protein